MLHRNRTHPTGTRPVVMMQETNRFPHGYSSSSSNPGAKNATLFGSVTHDQEIQSSVVSNPPTSSNDHSSNPLAESSASGMLHNSSSRLTTKAPQNSAPLSSVTYELVPKLTNKLKGEKRKMFPPESSSSVKSQKRLHGRMEAPLDGRTLPSSQVPHSIGPQSKDPMYQSSHEHTKTRSAEESSRQLLPQNSANNAIAASRPSIGGDRVPILDDSDEDENGIERCDTRWHYVFPFYGCVSLKCFRVFASMLTAEHCKLFLYVAFEALQTRRGRISSISYYLQGRFPRNSHATGVTFTCGNLCCPLPILLQLVG